MGLQISHGTLYSISFIAVQNLSISYIAYMILTVSLIAEM